MSNLRYKYKVTGLGTTLLNEIVEVYPYHDVLYLSQEVEKLIIKFNKDTKHIVK